MYHKDNKIAEKPDVGYWTNPPVVEDVKIQGILLATLQEVLDIPKNIPDDDWNNRYAEILYKTKVQLGASVYIVGKDDVDETPTEKTERIKRVIDEFYKKLGNICNVTVDGSEDRARLMTDLYKETPIEYVPENKIKIKKKDF